MQISASVNLEQAHTRNREMLWALGFGGFLVNADNRAIAPMLAAMAVTLHTTTAATALLVTAYSIPYGLFQLIYGPLADRIGKLSTILGSLALFAVGTICCGLVSTFGALLVLRVLTGVFAAGIIPTTLAQIGDRFATAERPGAIAFFMSLCTSGQAMGIVIGGIVAQFLSYRYLFLLLGAAAVPAFLVTLRQRARPQVTPLSSQRTPLAARYGALLRQRFARLIYALVFVEGFVFYGGFTFLGVYGVQNLHLSYFAIGLLTALFSAGAFVGSRTISTVLRRVGTGWLPVLGAGILTAGYGLIWQFSTVWALAVGFVVLGMGYSYCHATLQSHATELLPSARATAVSLFAFSLFVGMGLGPIAAGQVFGHFGMHAMLGSVTVGMAAFACACLSLARRHRRLAEHETMNM